MGSVAMTTKSLTSLSEITCATLSPIELRRRVLQCKAFVDVQMIQLPAEALYLPARRLSQTHTRRRRSLGAIGCR